MKANDKSSLSQTVSLTRREALRRALTCGLAAAALPAAATSNVLPAPVEQEFVPENDYPYFGAEPSTD